MAILLGSCQSRKIALVEKLSERSDHELQETILYDGSISTGTRGTGTIFETDIDGQKRPFGGGGAQTQDFLGNSWIFCGFLAFSWKFHGNSKMDPEKNGSEVDFGRRGNTPWSSNRRAFQAQLASQTPPDPQETPQTPPQEFWKIFF